MVWYINTLSNELSEEAENEKRMAFIAIDLFKWLLEGSPVFAKALINNHYMSRNNMRKLTAHNSMRKCRRHIEHGAHREVEAAEKCDQAICPKKEKSLAKSTMTLPVNWRKPWMVTRNGWNKQHLQPQCTVPSVPTSRPLLGRSQINFQNQLLKPPIYNYLLIKGTSYVRLGKAKCST